jgi:outer membrane protein assembly factor BamB
MAIDMRSHLFCLLLAFALLMMHLDLLAQAVPPDTQKTIMRQLQPPEVVWKVKAIAPVISSPVVSDRFVYFGCLDSVFYALDLATGRTAWTFRTKGEIRSTACIEEDRLYLNGGDGNLYCLNKKSGKLLWTFSTQGEKKHDFADYYQSSPVLRQNRLFFGSGDGQVYALDSESGALVWSYQTGDVVHATPAVANDRLFVGSFDGYLYALGAANGELIWKFKSVGQHWFPKGEFQGSPAVGKGLVLVGSRDYNLYAVDQAEGYCHWNRRFTRGWALANTVADSVLYTGTSDDRVLVATDVASGLELWRANLHFNIFGGLAISAGVGYVGTLMGKLFGIDLQTGAILWTFATDGYQQNHLKYFKPDDSFRDDIFSFVKSDEAFIDVENELGAIFSTPAIAGDYIVITSTEGSVYCLKLLSR